MNGLVRIIMHWTAGAYGVNDLERQHYHFIVGPDGAVTAGRFKPEANIRISTTDYAAHTFQCNTGSIGVSMDAMAGAVERPFDAGKCPITQVQLAAFAKLIADLCLKYNIRVTRQTVLSHAEVQPTLGITQKQKWDIAWLPGMDKPGDPVVVGDRLRALISGYLS